MPVAHARDIDDRDFLSAVHAVIERKGIWADRFEITRQLAGVPYEVTHPDDEAIDAVVPFKVVLAKMRRLENRNPPLITCCSCGCRGDIELTYAGAVVLAQPILMTTASPATGKL